MNIYISVYHRMYIKWLSVPLTIIFAYAKMYVWLRNNRYKHNHPSHNLNDSFWDLSTTKRFKKYVAKSVSVLIRTRNSLLQYGRCPSISNDLRDILLQNVRSYKVSLDSAAILASLAMRRATLADSCVALSVTSNLSRYFPRNNRPCEYSADPAL